MNITCVKKEHILSALLFFCFFQFSFTSINESSQISELKTLHHDLQKATDTTKIRILLDIAWYYMTINTDSALVYGKKALSLSRGVNDLFLAKSESILGDAYNLSADYENAIRYDQEAFHHAQKSNYKKAYTILLNNIGTNYLMLYDFGKSLEYFTEALKYSKTYDDKVLTYANLAQVLMYQNKFAKADEYYEMALKLAKQENNTKDIATIYDRLGELCQLKKSYSKSLYYFEEGLKLLDANDFYMRSECLRGITVSYIDAKQFEKALKSAQQADTIAKKGGFIFELKDINLLLSQIHEALGKPSLALTYHKRYVVYKDSIFNGEKNKRMNFLQTEFETRRKELLVDNLQKEAAFHQKMNYVYLVVGILTMLVLFFFIKDIRQKNKKLQIGKELAEERLKNEQEKAKIVKERLLQQKEKEQLEKQKLELTLDEKYREILTHTLQINQQREVLTSIQSEITDIIKLEDAQEIINSVKLFNSEIKSRIDLSDDWQQIKLHFEKVHPDFFDKLKSDFPELTTHELKMCAFTKLKFSSKEIGRLININPKSVQMLRYRVRKKMNIPEDVNFNDFITERT
jgi:tetratricopeptide (TPR) repeat protein